MDFYGRSFGSATKEKTMYTKEQREAAVRFFAEEMAHFDKQFGHIQGRGSRFRAAILVIEKGVSA